MTIDYFSPEWRAWNEMIHGDIAVGDLFVDDKFIYIVWRIEPPKTMPPDNLFDNGTVILCFKDFKDKSPKVDFKISYGAVVDSYGAVVDMDWTVQMPLMELLNSDTIKKIKNTKEA